jgi:hypothetical protein
MKNNLAWHCADGYTPRLFVEHPEDRRGSVLSLSNRRVDHQLRRIIGADQSIDAGYAS